MPKTRNNYKQIFLIYDGQMTELLMVTTSRYKAKCFIKHKIRKGEFNYKSPELSIDKQLKLFEEDFKNKTRIEINHNLINVSYTYVYDGEEF